MVDLEYLCDHNFPCTDCPVLPPDDKDELIEWYESALKFITSEETCQACTSARDKGVVNLCSKHRPAWMIAKGALNGWNYQGGQPLSDTDNACKDCSHRPEEHASDADAFCLVSSCSCQGLHYQCEC